LLTRTQNPVVAESDAVVNEGAVAPGIGSAGAWNHWYDSGAVPSAATMRVAVCPDAMMAPCGCAVMVGATPDGGATVIVAVDESADPAAFDTRAQYVVVDVSPGVVKFAFVAPATGDAVSPAAPANHWNASGAVPVAASDSVAL
jgi:hypothetical protein